MAIPVVFDQNTVKFIAAVHQTTQDMNQISSHRAADAAIIHLEDFFICIDNQCIIYTDFTEFVLNNRPPQGVLLAENIANLML